MPNIKPVSDLRNRNDILCDIASGKPVFSTKNVGGRYAIVHMADDKKQYAAFELLTELAKGEESARKDGWLKEEDVRVMLGV